MDAYYRDDLSEIYLHDSITGMAELPEGLTDLVVTSPPYNVGEKYEQNVQFGDYLKLLADFYAASLRIVKKGGYAIVNFDDYYIFDGSNTTVQPMTYLHHLIAEHQGWQHKCTRYWQKDYATLVDPYTVATTLPKGEVEFICLDDQTEVLTKLGWKLFSILSPEDDVATLNAWDEIEYHKPTRIINLPYSGNLISISGRTVDIRCTPNHNLYARPVYASESFDLYPAEELFGHTFELKIGGAVWNGINNHTFILPTVDSRTWHRNSVAIPMDLWVEFLGYYLSEGSLYSGNNRKEYRVTISQQPNSPYYDRIKHCLLQLPFNVHFMSNGSATMHDKRLYTYLEQNCGKGFYNKHIPIDIKCLSTRYLQILINSLLAGDGTVCGVTPALGVNSPLLSDDFQEIVLKCGYGSTKHGYSDGRFRVSVLSTQNSGKDTTTPEIVRGNTEYVSYVGNVYCCEVKNHIILVRRNGKPVWIGNCTFRKPGGGKEKIREQDLHTRQLWSTAGIKQATATRKHHQAAFPEELVRKILMVYADKGDTVVDPFMGSGTTIYVAKKLGIHGIGFDTDPQEVDLAAIRCSQQMFDIDARKIRQPSLTDSVALPVNPPPEDF